MKKSCLLLLLCTAFLISCEDQSEIVPSSDELSVVQDVDMTDFYLYTDQSDDTGKIANGKGSIEKCYSMKMLNKQLDVNPGLYQKMYNVEKHARQFIAGKKPTNPGGGNGNGGNGGGEDPTDPPTEYQPLTINVIVNIIENSPNDVTEQQINSQIAVLNEDFNNSNSNTNSAPSEFANLVADAKITFVLADVNRRTSGTTNWGTNDAMKYSSQGGIDVTDPANNLNIWVVPQMQTSNGQILGYAQFPGGPDATDGVVLGRNFFGVTSGNFGGGRTATHEVGHYLNLRHIWGDGRCNRDDFVSDTPRSDRYNTGCPEYPTVHCRNNDMTMNYMDYVNDDCMYMFTNGQNDRMRALFASGGIREDLIN
ncbi:MAG: zinc metalloprotease [Bacteroidetes bacterium MedPE-SWsnd-G1]|nr:MAG: zinc metalloprotease [Bacteroidetes bacterium MedPE-SWsnd-G1]